MKKIIITFLLFVGGVVTYFTFFSTEKSWSKAEILNSVASENLSGSGYRDLEGKFIDYEYDDFGSFGLAIYDNKIKWRGYGGYFDDIVSQVEPQISKIADNVYFLSWVFGEGGGDNVVVNFDTKKVYAHLRSSSAAENSPSDFEMISGSVNCGPSTNCKFPEGDPISMLQMILKLNANTKKFDLPTIFETEKPLVAAHKDARKELAGVAINYKTDDETISIHVDEKTTKLVVDRVPNEYQTNVSKIGEGIYFISWLGNKQFGEHIVFNKNTGKIFDHMNTSLQRGEKIYNYIPNKY